MRTLIFDLLIQVFNVRSYGHLPVTHRCRCGRSPLTPRAR